MVRSTKKTLCAQHTAELKQAVKTFVLMNITELLAAGDDDWSTSDIVTQMIVGYTNEALDELLTSLTALASAKGRAVNV